MSKTLIEALIRSEDPLGIEIHEMEGHMCNLKSYKISTKHEIRRGISRGNQCWCSSDNYEENKEFTNDLHEAEANYFFVNHCGRGNRFQFKSSEMITTSVYPNEILIVIEVGLRV